MNVTRYMQSRYQDVEAEYADVCAPSAAVERDAPSGIQDVESERCSLSKGERGFFEPADAGDTLELVELILKDRARLHRVVRDPSLKGMLIPKFLGISLSSFVLFGVAMSIVLSAAGVWPQLVSIDAWLASDFKPLIRFAGESAAASPLGPWIGGSALDLIAAYSLGLIAASGICLPSLYFFGLLTGVRMSMLDVTVHALKAKSTAAVALIGILPIYAAICLGMVVFQAPQALMNSTLLLGLVLPFIAGLWGTRSLYVGFAGLCDTMPEDRRAWRECFLRRLVFSWCIVYSAVTPVMIHTLWAFLSA